MKEKKCLLLSVLLIQIIKENSFLTRKKIKTYLKLKVVSDVQCSFFFSTIFTERRAKISNTSNEDH